MRIRSIKPYMWQDEKIGAISRDARLLFVGLITLADDEGRFRALPPVVCGHAFPYDRDAPRKLSKWLAELATAGLIVLYEGGACGWIPKWETHQRIHHPTPSLLPNPSRTIHESFPNGSRKIPE